MIDLRDYLTEESIIALPEAPYGVLLQMMVDHCLHDCPLELRMAVMKDIRLKRRGGFPQEVNLGDGFGLVHARMEAVQKIHFSVGILEKPKKLMQGDKVQSVFCIVLPQSESRLYLSILAKLGRMLQHPEVAAAFADAGGLFSQTMYHEARGAIIERIVHFEGR